MSGRPDGDAIGAAATGDVHLPNLTAPLGDRRELLGEGTAWDARAGRLLRVDIAAGKVHAWRPSSGEHTTFDVGAEVSAAVPRDGGGLVLAVGRELVVRAEDGTTRVLAAVEGDRPDNRFNDCRCDSRGRLWAGTMSRSRVPGSAALYRLVAGRPIDCVIPRTTLSNGIGWSPSRDHMYFVDSVEQRIDVLDFDVTDGTISGRRPFARIAREDGLPDGLCVDSEGGVWVCLYGGRAIRRYDERGGLDVHLPLPVTNPTCPAFGGPDLGTLYVTTARHRLTPAQLAREPLAGALLALDPGGVTGLPAHAFDG